MGPGSLDLNLIPVLLALLEEKNVTRAGNRLKMQTPHVSEALAHLRRYYSDPLLARDGKEYALTPLARSLLPSVRETAALIGQAFTAGGYQPPAGPAEVTIGISENSAVLFEDGLLRRVLEEVAAGTRLELRQITPPSPADSGRQALEHDLLIAPVGPYQPGGQPEVIFRDRLVCVADPGNPRLRDGQLSAQDLKALPHAAVEDPHAAAYLVRAALGSAGITPSVALCTADWLTLLFMVAGTSMVAVVPERLARRCGGAAGVTIAEPPFGRAEITEAAWWHPDRAADPALAWLRAIVREIAADQPGAAR